MFFKSRGLRGGALPRGAFVFIKITGLFWSMGARVRGIASRGRFFSNNDSFSFLDITFRVNVAKPPCPTTKYSLSELIHLIHVIPRNCPNRAGQHLGSTHAQGKDDGSSCKLGAVDFATRSSSKKLPKHWNSSINISSWSYFELFLFISATWDYSWSFRKFPLTKLMLSTRSSFLDR